MNNKSENNKKNNKKETLPGYKPYPDDEDIFVRDKEEDLIDPEDNSKTKSSPVKPGRNNEKDFKDDKSGGDLDVPGSEQDDLEEIAGSEDEENNYYSLGGDNHDDLEEDKGD